MLLANYFAWMYSQRDNSNNTAFPTTIKNLSGTVENICHGHSYGGQMSYDYGHNGFKLRFGFSDTPSDRNQYRMNYDITVDNYVTISTQNWTAGNNLDSIEYVFIANLVNSTSNPQVIKEVGITKQLYRSSANTGGYEALIAHEVLSEPITIPANGAKTVKYIWTIS